MGDAEWTSLDLNQASAEELTVLPGVGIKKAHKIVQYREEQRQKLRRHKKASKVVFKSAADLEQVPLTESLARRIAGLLHLEAESTAGAEHCEWGLPMEHLIGNLQEEVRSPALRLR